MDAPDFGCLLRVDKFKLLDRLLCNSLFVTILGASESGDVVLRCGLNGMIDILNIKMNETDLQEQERESIKQQCAMKMFQAPQQSPGYKQPVFCIVSRQGRNGDLKVRYQCLQTPQKATSQVLMNKTNTGLLSRQLQHFTRLHKLRKHKPRN